MDGGERVLWGGRITTRRTEPKRLAELLRRTMVSTYPQLEGVRVETAWSGLMAYARHLMPLIGQLQPGVWHALGFGGHGMNTTAIGGRVVAEGILGSSDRYKLYRALQPCLEWRPLRRCRRPTHILDLPGAGSRARASCRSSGLNDAGVRSSVVSKAKATLKKAAIGPHAV